MLASACPYGHDTTFFADNGFYASARASHWYNLSNYFGFRLWNIMLFWHFSSHSINIQQWILSFDLYIVLIAPKSPGNDFSSTKNGSIFSFLFCIFCVFCKSVEPCVWPPAAPQLWRANKHGQSHLIKVNVCSKKTNRMFQNVRSSIDPMFPTKFIFQ